MTGKILKVSSNDLYGNTDDRFVTLLACFEHTKYMNKYAVFIINNNLNKLCYGSVHFKKNSLVVFSVNDSIKKHINSFLDEYLRDDLKEFKLLDVDKVGKIELISHNEMEYENIYLLKEKAIPTVTVDAPVEEKEKKPIFLYFLLFILVSLAVFVTVLYFKPDMFSVKYNGLECINNLYDQNMKLNYSIIKNIKFKENNKVDNISVVKTYTFLDSDSYYNFKDSEEYNNYFTNGEAYKFVDAELKLKLFYDELSVIDDYDEMFVYMKREGFNCVAYEYEK